MRDLLRRAKPSRFDDLIALNALYRPGPLKSGMVDDWVERKQGKREVKYELAQLEPILRDSYGVIAYQEQVLRIAQAVAGFTLGQADVLRKAMGKKDPQVMAKQREAFVGGARAKGIGDKKAVKLFEQIEHFAGYGFNKAHATAYALLAYRTAYLKANYPWHFAASLFTIEAQNTDKLAMYIAEARERGIAVLPPDINESQLQFSVVPEGVRFGLTAIKGLGEAAILAILDVRRREGRITSLNQLAEALDLRIANRRVFEALVKSGACDGLAQLAGAPPPPPAVGRARLMRVIDAALEHGARVQRDREQGQANLFGDGGPAGAETPSRGLPDGPPWTEMEWLAFEKEALGLYLSGHPVDRHAAALRALGARTVGDLVLAEVTPDEEGGPGRLVLDDVAVGGIVSAVRPLKTKKGDAMAVFTLEDHQGAVEVVAFPEVYGRFRHLIDVGALLLVRGKFERDDDSSRFQAAELSPLEALRERLAKAVSIHLPAEAMSRAMLEALWDLLAQHQGDRPIVLEVEVAPASRRLRVRADVTPQIRVRPSEQLVSAVERLCGAGSVVLQ